MTREQCLDEARKCVCGDRPQDYGSPEKNFESIAKLWEWYLKADGKEIEVTARNVAHMMILLKLARDASGHGKDDNMVDVAGYAACASEL